MIVEHPTVRVVCLAGRAVPQIIITFFGHADGVFWIFWERAARLYLDVLLRRFFFACKECSLCERAPAVKL